MTQNELQNGATLQHGKYIILSVLGKGGFGITYLAEHSVLKKKVAIKELFLSTQSIFCSRKEDDSRTVRPHFQAQDFEVFKEKFLTEASTLARFTGQKGIVQINDTFPENNTVYFVMDFIDGYSVKEIVHQKGVLSEKEAITYILQILYALKEVHAADILHRDIKPDNLIIRKQDQQIILIDFGIAREFSEDETQTQTAMISVGYAPPEQKLTKAKRSQSMDLYSVGAVLYFCLTSQRPQTSDEILSEEYKSAQTLNSTISDTLNQIIDKSIAKRPKERFQTASEMIEVLENYSISDVGIISDVVGKDTNNGEDSFNQKAIIEIVSKPILQEDDNTVLETQNDFVIENNNDKEKPEETLKNNKKKFFQISIGTLILLLFFISFYKNSNNNKLELKTWEIAKEENTKESYSEYKFKYPNGEFSEEADNLMNEIDYWEQTVRIDIKEEYENYLSKYPNGIYKIAAEKKIMSINLQNIQETNENEKQAEEQRKDNIYGENSVYRIINSQNSSEVKTRMENLISNYNYIGYFNENLAVVEKDKMYGFINKKMELVIPLKYKFAFDFREGLALVKNKTKKYGFINDVGEVVIGFQYDDASLFSNDSAKVKLNQKYFYINRKGKCIKNCR